MKEPWAATPVLYPARPHETVSPRGGEGLDSFKKGVPIENGFLSKCRALWPLQILAAEDAQPKREGGFYHILNPIKPPASEFSTARRFKRGNPLQDIRQTHRCEKRGGDRRERGEHRGRG